MGREKTELHEALAGWIADGAKGPPAAFLDFFHEGIKTPADRRVGVEYERLPVHQDGMMRR